MNFSIRLKNIIYVFLLIGITLIIGCFHDLKDEEPRITEEIEFFELKSGSISTQLTRLLQVYESQEAFSEAYELIMPNTTEIPVIDFSKNKVIGLFMGERSSGGFSIEATKIIKKEDHTLVEVTLNQIGSDCPADGTFSQPFQYIQIDDSRGQIVFSEKVVINECDIAVIPDETQALDYTVLREGNYGQYTITRVLEVFADQDSFEHAFDLSGAETNPPTAPLVDFTKNRVIGLFMWENGSVGYHHIRTTSVTQNGVAIVFNVELTKPKPGCPSDNALSQPFQFVSIEKLSLPIIFSESLTELGCN